MTERKKYAFTPLSASGKEKYISGSADFGAAARHGHGFHTQPNYCHGRWPAAYININVNTHQIQVLTEPLCRAQAIFYLLPNNEWGTTYRGLTYSAK